MNNKTKVISIIILSILIALFFILTVIGIVFVVTGFIQENPNKYIQGFVFIPLGLIFAMFTIVILVMVSKKQKKYWKN